jgi:hypothetical protein
MKEYLTMSDNSTHALGVDLETGLPLDRDELLVSGELERRLKSGELTRTQANEILQAAERRHTAEHGPDLDTNEDGVITEGGFGSGQGMAKQSTGQGHSDGRRTGR